MAEFAPQTELFKIINNLSSFGQFLFWIILGFSVSPLILNEFNLPESITDILNILNITGITAFFLIEILIDFILLPQADSKRRDDFIDNSFGSKFSPKNSVGYYDNDEIGKGLYKTSVNLFENCFFTFSLVKIITTRKIIIPILMVVFMSILAYYGFKKVPFALSILQALFSANILGLLIKHLILLNRLSTIQDSWIGLFQNEEFRNEPFKYQANIYRYWLQYETLHSKINAGIPDSIFKKNNALLTTEWETIKSKYNIH
ncbi:hypothetical protein [Chryseobacterium chendengshani]|uniref:hypothetical protein n=1 Tax=Chryseobacterium sp. LJ756 TaxID=2864113 RepID=UPI001C63CB51|nr:hypothetical protein [Chryseobacterium sp. LJ756]MBW7674773.1 hypothetical protein [Chryseobacterium sp. LJ756]